MRLLTLADLDRRTRAYQRAASLRDELLSDLGGPEHVSVAQRELAERTAVTSAMLTDIEARWLSGEMVDLAHYFTGQNAQRRNLQTLGLERRAKDITASLADYVTRARTIEDSPRPHSESLAAEMGLSATILAEKYDAAPEPTVAISEPLAVEPEPVIVEPVPAAGAPRPLRINEVVEVPGGSIMFIEIAADGREKYACFDRAGRQHARMFGREAAEQFVSKLVGLAP
jgi:hypothetical protein